MHSFTRILDLSDKRSVRQIIANINITAICQIPLKYLVIHVPALSGLIYPLRMLGPALLTACIIAAGQTEPLLTVTKVSIIPNKVQKRHILAIPTKGNPG